MSRDDPLYYEQEFSKLILQSIPVECRNDGAYELHMLTCQRDLIMALWALKTFYHYSGERPPLVIHDDGSLTDDSAALLAEHFRGSRVVRHGETLCDPTFRAKFTDFPLCETWRFKSRPKLAIRAFDFTHFAATPYILEFDSDILFFKEPSDIIECCADREPFMSTDYRSSYVFSPDVAENALMIPLLRKINTGLGGFPLTMIDFAAIEQILEVMIEHNVHSGIFPASRLWIEQTVTACLFCHAGYSKMLDIARYQLSTMLINEDTICQHFVRDGSRAFFYDWGLRYLDDLGFLEAQARR